MDYRNGAVRRSFALLAASFWVYLSAMFVPLFHAINKLFLRYEQGQDPLRDLDETQKVVNFPLFTAQDHEKSSTGCPPVQAEEKELDTVNCPGLSSRLEKSGGDSPKLFLSFKFPTFEEFSTNNRVNLDPKPDSPETVQEEEEVFSCTNEELRSESNDDCCSDGNFASEVRVLAEEALSKSYEHHKLIGPCREPAGHHESEEKEMKPIIEDNLSEEKGRFFFDKADPMRFRVLTAKDLLMSDSDTDSMSSSHDFSIMSRLLDSNSDGSLSDGDFEVDEDLREELRKLEHEESIHKQEEEEEGEELDEDGYPELDEDLREELRKLELEESIHKEEEEVEGEALDDAEVEFSSLEKSTSHSSGNTAEPESKDSRMEVEWEHQDLIEQLRMEIRKVKATGLPTIAEDSESPRITEDLKPWKIDEKLHRGDRITELHKVHKSYQERMRKFDILNYQKMYALGYLRKKDPFKSISSQKSQAPSVAIASILPQALRLCREDVRSHDDPMAKLLQELHGDLETVYVGQLCLSWEFLQWQYEKALELWEADPYNLCRYSKAANEFQRLQVLMQRFLENEQFEGPRVQSYVKSRCMLRHLLQIPVIREDNLKVKRKNRIEGKHEFSVSSDVLVEILEESIRIFWRFVQADKDASSSVYTGRKSGHPELQDPADLELFSNVQTALQKKEKKLKEVLKGRNCVWRKLKKRHHDQEDGSSSDQVLAFFSQVDMKLVRRVLNMSRVSTDQLGWCSGKLSRIHFVDRRIRVEPSFLLFPC